MNPNPLLEMAETQKYQRLEKHMDQIETEIKNLEAELDAIKQSVETLNKTSTSLVEAFSQLTFTVTKAESILNTLKEQKGAPSNGIS